MCFNSKCQPPWSAILEKVSHAGKICFTITLQQILILTQIFKKKISTLQLLYDRPIYSKVEGEMCVLF